MTEYTNFDQIMRDENLDDAARIAYTNEWLLGRYGLEIPTPLVAELTRVHDHDNLAKHFGQLKLATAFQNAWLQVEKTSPGTWSLTYSYAGPEAQPSILPHKNDKKQDQSNTEKIQRLINAIGVIESQNTTVSQQATMEQKILQSIDSQITNPVLDEPDEQEQFSTHRMPLATYLGDPSAPSIPVPDFKA